MEIRLSHHLKRPIPDSPPASTVLDQQTLVPRCGDSFGDGVQSPPSGILGPVLSPHMEWVSVTNGTSEVRVGKNAEARGEDPVPAATAQAGEPASRTSARLQS